MVGRKKGLKKGANSSQRSGKKRNSQAFLTVEEKPADNRETNKSVHESKETPTINEQKNETSIIESTVVELPNTSQDSEYNNHSIILFLYFITPKS